MISREEPTPKTQVHGKLIKIPLQENKSNIDGRAFQWPSKISDLAHGDFKELKDLKLEKLTVWTKYEKQKHLIAVRVTLSNGK